MTTVQISISGRGAPDEAPTVRDLLEQLADFFDMTEEVAGSISGDNVPRFEWRVVGLSKNSPATITAEARPLRGTSGGEALARKAVVAAADGLRALQTSGERPPFFTDNVLSLAEHIARRVNGGLAATTIKPDDDEPAVVAPEGAFAAVQNIETARGTGAVRGYTELGTVEGFIQSAGADGWGKPYVLIKHRVTGGEVKCMLSGNARAALEREPLGAVAWRRRRVQLWGVLRFKTPGRLSTADVSELSFFTPDSELPSLADIIDPQFTGGLSSDDYLARLRNADA